LPFLHQEEKQLMKIESNIDSSRKKGRHYMTTFFYSSRMNHALTINPASFT
jgi:hypothetical protein